MAPPRAPFPASPAAGWRVPVALVFLFALLLTALWLWSCWCAFPSNPWNDIRLAPAVAMHLGVSVFNPPGVGPASTWAYGPLPLWVLWPAGFATDAVAAIETGGAISIGVRVLTLVAVVLWWPLPPRADGGPHRFVLRGSAALLGVLLVRNENSGFSLLTADGIGISLGLLGLLALARGRYWWAALGAAGAVACKQTLAGIGAAEIAWLLLAVSPREAWRQVGRGAIAGVVLALLAIAQFGGRGLWHVMFEMPGKYPWAAVGERLAVHQTYLGWHVVLPLAVMVLARRHFFARSSPLLLPSLAFLLTLPLGIAGLLKIGGNVNQLHSFWFWFPPTLAAIVSNERLARSGPARLAVAALPAAVACLWLTLGPVRVVPNVGHYREAAALAARLPRQIWFPMNPLVTLYSDHRLYHDFDGLRVRGTDGFPVSDAAFAAHVPAERKLMATLLPIGWLPADDARLLPGAQTGVYGSWRLDGTLP